MRILITSPDVIVKSGEMADALITALKDIRDSGVPVGVVSNHKEPSWFSGKFGDSKVQFLHQPNRQSGKIISENVKEKSLHPFDVLVLAGKIDDISMGKNGGAIIIAAGWSDVPAVRALGIAVKTPQELLEVVKLSSSWDGHWWYSASAAAYEIRALINLSGINQSQAQQDFAHKLTATVKKGGARLNALLTIIVRSLLMDGFDSEPKSNLLWGVYPSSKSKNNDNEILSDFTHRLRTAVSRAKLSKRGEPLFIRHTESSKRSAGSSTNREDPSEQIETLHLNPFYKDNKRLVGKEVILVDDCTTYGVSFGVAAAFLKKAGAAKVTCIALGKFGNCLQAYDILINSSPFEPVKQGDYVIKLVYSLAGTSDNSVQNSLLGLIK